MVPLSQVLADLGVADGQVVPAISAESVASRIRSKLESFATPRTPRGKGTPLADPVDFADPEVWLEPVKGDRHSMRLRISAKTRTAPAPAKVKR